MRRSDPAYALIRNDEDSTGLNSDAPGLEMPYSVSIPMTFGIAMWLLQVLAGADPFDLPPGSALVGDQRADVHDPLALLARDACPVVRVRRVRQVLVLLELLADRGEQVLRLQALLAGLQEPLDGLLLRPAHDVLDHGSRGEVLEEQDLLVARRVRDLEEPVLVGLGVHPLGGLVDHPVHGAREVAL